MKIIASISRYIFPLIRKKLKLKLKLKKKEEEDKFLVHANQFEEFASQFHFDQPKPGPYRYENPWSPSFLPSL